MTPDKIIVTDDGSPKSKIPVKVTRPVETEETVFEGNLEHLDKRLQDIVDTRVKLDQEEIDLIALKGKIQIELDKLPDRPTPPVELP